MPFFQPWSSCCYLSDFLYYFSSFILLLHYFFSFSLFLILLLLLPSSFFCCTSFSSSSPCFPLLPTVIPSSSCYPSSIRSAHRSPVIAVSSFYPSSCPSSSSSSSIPTQPAPAPPPLRHPASRYPHRLLMLINWGNWRHLWVIPICFWSFVAVASSALLMFRPISLIKFSIAHNPFPPLPPPLLCILLPVIIWPASSTALFPHTQSIGLPCWCSVSLSAWLVFAGKGKLSSDDRTVTWPRSILFLRDWTYDPADA